MSKGKLSFRELDKLMKYVLAQGCHYVVSTLGRNGCYVVSKQENLVVPSFSVKTVDTTGAGDAFQGGFIAGLLEKMKVSKIAEFANAVGALTVTAIGPRTSPNGEELEHFLRSKHRL